MDNLAFISKYEEILRERKIPKMQFYKSCGISDAAVSQWRKGKTNPAMTTINKISGYLGVPISYLLGDSKIHDGVLFDNGAGYGGGFGSGSGFGDGSGFGGHVLDIKKSPTPEGVELDEETIQLREIWDSADQEERDALLAMAKMLKARRNK